MTRAALAIGALVGVFAVSFGLGTAVRGDDGAPSKPGSAARALSTPRVSPRIDPLASSPGLPDLRGSAGSSAPPAPVTPPPPSSGSNPGAGTRPPAPPAPVLPPDPLPR